MEEENYRSWIVVKDIPAGRLMPHIIPAGTWYVDVDHGMALSGYYRPNFHEAPRTHGAQVSEIDVLVGEGFMKLEDRESKFARLCAEGAD